jgi:hypothetical protein
MRILLFVLIVALLSNCGIIREREMRAQAEELKARSVAAAQACDSTVPAGNPKTAMARAKCQTDALAIMRPIMPFPDLMDLSIASRIATAERIQSGQITIAQGNEIVAQRQSELIAEEQRRSLANRAVYAQETMASAAAAPRTCTAIGNTVNCF